MKSLHGSVSVDETPGGGALFTLVFPQTTIASDSAQLTSVAV
jgi:chemotaxis protein histidine kinase CheA